MNTAIREHEIGNTDEEEASSFLISPSSLPAPSAFNLQAVTVRAYQPSDYAAALALWQEAELRPYLEPELERLLGSGGGALVAVAPQSESDGNTNTASTENSVDTQVVGIVLWSHNGSVGILWRLAVAENQRGRGIATRLLNRAEQDIYDAGLSGVTLLTRVNNTVAKSMYSKRGYKWNDHLEFWGKKLSGQREPILAVSDSAQGRSVGGDEEQTSC